MKLKIISRAAAIALAMLLMVGVAHANTVTGGASTHVNLSATLVTSATANCSPSTVSFGNIPFASYFVATAATPVVCNFTYTTYPGAFVSLYAGTTGMAGTAGSLNSFFVQVSDTLEHTVSSACNGTDGLTAGQPPAQTINPLNFCVLGGGGVNINTAAYGGGTGTGSVTDTFTIALAQPTMALGLLNLGTLSGSITFEIDWM